MLTTVLLTLGAAVLPMKAPTEKNAYHHNSDVSAAWFHLLYDRVKAEGFSPPVASRIYGAAGVCLYESMIDGMPKHRSLDGQLNQLVNVPNALKNRKYHWPSVANATLGRLLETLFAGKPSSIAAFDALEQQIAASFASTVSATTLGNSVSHGQAVADSIAAWLSTDGYAIYNNCAFVPPAGPGLWVPTPPAFVANPLQPCWGLLRPFALADGSEGAPAGHPAYSTSTSSEFYAYAFEVYSTVNSLTPEQATIAVYWADGPVQTGTPPGHWIDIVRQISLNKPLNLGDSAEAFARVGISVADAFIACWNTKYTHNLLRPITYIRANIDPLWNAYIGTPPFPEFTSGHSTQSGASSAILADMLGHNYRFTDTTHTDHGLVPAMSPRTFASLDEAAVEAKDSRLYGGIHYRFGNDEGYEQGKRIAGIILSRVRFTKKNGH